MTSHQASTSPARAQYNHLASSPPELLTNWGQSIATSPRSPYSNHSPASTHSPIEISSYRSNSSTYSSHSHLPIAYSPINSSPGLNNSDQSTQSQRNLSPYAAPFIPRSAQRNGSPQLFLPPPFSATSRNVSISSAYPPSSPASPHTSPQRQSSNNILPSIAQYDQSDHQPSISISPTAPPPPRRIAVYNDRLSPSQQPRTPAGLPRNGVPAMATHNPFNTAPVGK